ncbi:hypothetical protein LOZ12_003021 [Ophidiomyces ophidiicola]|nr:hypothetical protein LOZ62_002954 [Ophidiomyces ophidiicola]KAI1957615.1 hypothetical protein LOZ59_003831 [Ophidiomyces ophidiicola]KAI1971296.1 hypothetical protein LOZ56_003115 [Ophidiomyces ophidiicola]KAI2006265.1 hypothetical protein LOZ50_003174 [Ophidiomyces ophidiicola]KAI2024570.1 hypothetical protein LOZ45_003543 [Ophidiomyces ophidiicola]
MNRGKVSPGAASSNHSSDEAASRNGSPETKLTAFSPEDVRMKSLLGHGTAIDACNNEAMAFASVHRAGLGNDPFIGSVGRAQLSPTASPFTPASYIHRSHLGNEYASAYLNHDLASQSKMSYLTLNSEPETPFTPNGSLARNSPPRFGPIAPGGVVSSAPKQIEVPQLNMGYLMATSVPETPFTPNGTLARNSPPRYGAIGQIHVASDLQPISFCQVGTFDKTNCNRAFVIEGVPKDFAYLTIVNLFEKRTYSSLKGPILTELGSHGRIYAAFADSRDARAVFEKINAMYPNWHFHGLTAKEFAGKLDATHVAWTSDYEGHILVSVFYNGNNPSADPRAISHNFKTTLEKFGDIKAFATIPTEQNHVIDFHVEFFDTHVAENVVSALDGSCVNGWVLDIKLYRPDATEIPYEYKKRSDAFAKQAFGSHSNAIGHSCIELSPTGRSTIPMGDPAGDLTWFCKSDDPYSYLPRPDFGRRNDNRINNQNYVDIEKVRLGLDVRTTIMLRNIPNKIDQAMLKHIVDETSFGKYDFMYLRIDFANNCNVGYAFINFEDPIDIIDFANARAGRTWNCFNSDKVAEISYATIQGRDCLVQKFRNSSVMLEHPSFRPKLFYTGMGPLAGTEERFPGPDNPSKMRRSVENAEHVGLFAPRVGQQYRDEQRRRRSQFDRGTTAAERENFWSRSQHPRRMSHENGNIHGHVQIPRLCEFQYHH